MGGTAISISHMRSTVAGGKYLAVSIKIYPPSGKAVIGIARSHNSARAFLQSERRRIGSPSLYTNALEKLDRVLKLRACRHIPEGHVGETSFATFWLDDADGLRDYRLAMSRHEERRRPLPSPPPRYKE